LVQVIEVRSYAVESRHTAAAIEDGDPVVREFPANFPPIALPAFPVESPLGEYFTGREIAALLGISGFRFCRHRRSPSLILPTVDAAQR
jgi:hypothetical protein